MHIFIESTCFRSIGHRRTSLRNVLMWAPALQRGAFVLSWQFTFEKQANWAAAETIFLALMVASEKSGDGSWDIVRAAAFSSRSADPWILLAWSTRTRTAPSSHSACKHATCETSGTRSSCSG